MNKRILVLLVLAFLALFGFGMVIDNPTITKIANLTTNGFVKTSGGNGTLGVDTTTYQTALTTGNLTAASPLVFDSTRQVIGGAAQASIPAATTSVDGYLTHTDWATFNGKAASNASTTVNSQTCTLGSSCTVTAVPSGSASGDLSGSYPGPTVAQVNGAAVPTSAIFTGTNASKQITGMTAAQALTAIGGQAALPALANQVYSSGDFTATTGTWTVTSGQLNEFNYILNGHVLTVNLIVYPGSTTSNSTVQLFVKVPGGYTATTVSYAMAYIAINGTAELGFSSVSGTSIAITRASGANFPASSNVIVAFTMVCFV